jgi:hypothetical protein
LHPATNDIGALAAGFNLFVEFLERVGATVVVEGGVCPRSEREGGLRLG